MGGGMRTVRADAPSEPQVDSTVGVSAGIRHRSKRTTWSLIYTPQIYVELPNTIDYGRPLYLHQLFGSYQSSLSQRSAVQIQLDGTLGELSYSSFRSVFQPGTTTSGAGVLPVFSSDGSINWSYRASRLHSLGVTASGGYRGSLEDSPEGSESEAFPTSYDAALVLSDGIALSTRDSLTISLRGGYLGSDRQPSEVTNLSEELVAIGSTVSWNRHLSSSSQLNVGVGGAATYGIDRQEFSFVPNLVITHVTNWQLGRQSWSSNLSTGANGFLDRGAATYRTQGFGSWSLSGTIGNDWSTGMSLYASTSLDPEPIQPPQYESTLSLSVPWYYQISLNSRLGFGASASLYAPHILEDEQLRPQGELTGYLSYRYAIGTDREHGQWLR